MLSLLILYLPSFVGLLLVNWQLYELMRIARDKKSPASYFITAVVMGMFGVLLSWFIVIRIASDLVAIGYSFLDWRVSLLPIFWGVMLILINHNLRK